MVEDAGEECAWSPTRVLPCSSAVPNRQPSHSHHHPRQPDRHPRRRGRCRPAGAPTPQEPSTPVIGGLPDSGANLHPGVILTAALLLALGTAITLTTTDP